MLTIETLKNYGADTDTGLQRCINNTDLYIKLVAMAAADENFERLGKAVEEHDLEAGFNASHALKGILSNLELTPILKEVVEIVEPFRRREEDYPYAEQYAIIMKAREELNALLNG